MVDTVGMFGHFFYFPDYAGMVGMMLAMTSTLLKSILCLVLVEWSTTLSKVWLHLFPQTIHPLYS
jgi:hypothetical protein